MSLRNRIEFPSFNSEGGCEPRWWAAYGFVGLSMSGDRVLLLDCNGFPARGTLDVDTATSVLEVRIHAIAVSDGDARNVLIDELWSAWESAAGVEL